MDTLTVGTVAKAMLHLTITRADRTVEERDVPAMTTLTSAQVRALIARQES